MIKSRQNEAAARFWILTTFFPEITKLWKTNFVDKRKTDQKLDLKTESL